MRRTVAQLLRTLDGWLPVRRMRMTWTVAAACAGYMALIALQLTLVAPPYDGAAAAAPSRDAIIRVSAESGVCLLPVCLLAPTCVAGVGSSCLLPVAPPAPVKPAPRAPIGASSAPGAPKHAAPAVAAPAVPAVHHAAAAPSAPAPQAPSAAVEVTRVDRAVPVVAAPSAATPVTGVPLPMPAAVSPAIPAAPSPAGSTWWLYALFVVLDGAAAVALVVLIRRTAASQSHR